MAGVNLLAGAEAAYVASRTAPRVDRAPTFEAARKIAQDFEAFFLSRMLQPMFEGIEAEEPFGGGHAERIWRSLQVDEYGKAMSRAGGIGIADTVLREILRLQEVTPA